MKWLNNLFKKKEQKKEGIFIRLKCNSCKKYYDDLNRIYCDCGHKLREAKSYSNFYHYFMDQPEKKQQYIVNQAIQGIIEKIKKE